MKKNNHKKIFIIIFISGLLLNISFFTRNIFGDYLAFFVMAPGLYYLLKIKEKKYSYLGWAIFLGAWLIPTSYWYFKFMPLGQAMISILFFLGFAKVIVIGIGNENQPLIVKYLRLLLTWSIFVYARINIPILKDWWVPNLAYTQWQNVTFMQLARIFGIYGVVFFILFSNILLGYFYEKKKKVAMIIYLILIFSGFTYGNTLLKEKSKNEKLKFSFISIQVSPENGIFANANENDISSMIELTKDALENLKDHSKKVFVIWPENMIDEKYMKRLIAFAKKEKIYLSVNIAEENEKNLPYNTSVLIGPTGGIYMKNYKTHAAPSEDISTSNFDSTSIEVDNVKITSDICYDLHFSDVSKRALGNHLILASVDDDRFGSYMPILHGIDIIYRAIENRIDIVTSGTSGPTFYIDKYGVIKNNKILKINEKNYLITE